MLKYKGFMIINTYNPTGSVNPRKGTVQEKKSLIGNGLEQVTRGHNIVAVGWAGASNLHPNPNSSPTLEHTQKVS